MSSQVTPLVFSTDTTKRLTTPGVRPVQSHRDTSRTTNSVSGLGRPSVSCANVDQDIFLPFLLTLLSLVLSLPLFRRNRDTLRLKFDGCLDHAESRAAQTTLDPRPNGPSLGQVYVRSKKKLLSVRGVCPKSGATQKCGKRFLAWFLHRGHNTDTGTHTKHLSAQQTDIGRP